MSNYGGRLPEGQVSEGSGVGGREAAGAGLVDLSGFTLSDLRDLRDADDESYLARALSRVLAGESAGHHGFQSKI